MSEIRCQHDVFSERAVNGWGGEEPHVGAEVVPAGLAFAAYPARYTGFQRDSLTCPRAIHSRAHRDYSPTGFVPEDERFPHDVFRDPSVLVVVHIGTADPDRADLNQDLARPGGRYRSLFEDDLPRPQQNAGA